MAKKILNRHNVYIIGAGFSFDARLPLIHDFIDRMRDAREPLSDQGRTTELEAIDNVLEMRREAAAAAERIRIQPENIEQLFSLISAQSGNAAMEKVSIAIGATLDVCTDQFNKHPTMADRLLAIPSGYSPTKWKQPPTWTPTPGKLLSGVPMYSIPLYQWIAGIISGAFCKRSGDEMNTVISFNYDTILEDSLRALEIPFSYGFERQTVNHNCSFGYGNSSPDDSLLLLKLHGSVNWGYRPGPGRSFTIYDTYHDAGAAGASPILVPPTWRKVLNNQLFDLWSKAIERLHVATRIVLVGFSMPDTDLHFRYLLAAALQGNISLRQILFANPNKSHVEMRCRETFVPDFIEHSIRNTGLTTSGLFVGEWREGDNNEAENALLGRTLELPLGID